MKYIKQMSDNTIPGVLRTFRMPVLSSRFQPMVGEALLSVPPIARR
jgi:hypothetical protein